MSFDNFADLLKNKPEYSEILSGINSGNFKCNISNIGGFALCHLIFSVSKNTGRNVVVFVNSNKEARQFKENLSCICSNVYTYTERDYIFSDLDSVGNENSEYRLEALNALKNRENSIVICSISAAMQYSCSASFFDDSKILVRYGEEYDFQKLLNQLSLLGYRRANLVESRGQFAVRGGIVDVFPSYSDNPFRIEFFDNEIDSIKIFDQLSQRSVNNADYLYITPASEFVLPTEKRSLIEKFIIDKKDTLEGYISQLAEKDLERIKNTGDFFCADRYLPYIYDRFPSFADYADSAAVFFSEPVKLKNQAERYMSDIVQLVSYGLEKSLLFPGTKDSDYIIPYDEILSRLSGGVIINVFNVEDAVDSSYPDFKKLDFSQKPAPSVKKSVNLLYDCVAGLKKENYTVVILSSNISRAKSISDLLVEKSIYPVLSEDFPEEMFPGSVVISVCSAFEGFLYEKEKIAVITEYELFGDRRRIKRSSKKALDNAVSITGFEDLSVGDLVVHRNHGIGCFVGTKSMEVDGTTADYIQIKYKSDDMLYIPAHQLNLIYKYRGSENVSLSRLGGSEWKSVKKKVKSACRDIAQDIIKIYAQRETAEGISFLRDGELSEEFDDSFRYVETEGQMRSINEVKRDMESSRPMDRLLCGDVGYGKTEVALRAAFKAAVSGYQTAYLVPTTILAFQHYSTFEQRMQRFPVKVEMLSRFKTAKQQSEIIEKLKTGEVDVVIGTHRLLQKDISFRKLGLLIIDEEQRFGVMHKESIKKLKTGIDVLTLTATPIPRTLHMTLVGIRDISIIDQPPRNRHPINTYIFEYNTDTVVNALRREFQRGGQSYYIFNNIRGIYKKTAELQKLLPDLKFAAAHGRMNESELEDIMISFMNHEIDVLVCTTIVETGVDIPNVNTMVIENADRFGLSQLYQLRGRVGRSDRIAYAYFTYRKDKILGEIAEKRLKAIKDFTEFGAGFKIAMRDLEIRGAGNIIGAEQHGHMDAVGYDLYCRLLSEAVSKLKDKDYVPETVVSVRLSADAFIPEKYIKNEKQRVEVYKKIAGVKSQEDYFDIYDEIEDRYGSVPESVNNLLEIVLLKTIASDVGIADITQRGRKVSFTFDENKFDLNFAIKITGLSNDFVLSPGAKPAVNYKKTNSRDIISDVKFILQEFWDLKNNTK